MYHYPDLDSASVASDLMAEANSQPIRSTTQTWGWWFISMEFLHLCHRRHFAEKPVVVSQNVGCNLRLTTTGSTTKTASEKWESQNVDCNIRLTIGVEKYEMGDSRKYPYPTTGGMSILTPPCPRKFQNAYPPLALRIPKSLTPPLLRNFPLLFQTLWNSCSSA